MEKLDTAPRTLIEINLGALIEAKWTTFLKEIKVLDSDNFGTVYLAEDLANGKLYVVKEVFTQGKTEKVQQLLFREPTQLEKVRKYNHPNF